MLQYKHKSRAKRVGTVTQINIANRKTECELETSTVLCKNYETIRIKVFKGFNWLMERVAINYPDLVVSSLIVLYSSQSSPPTFPDLMVRTV